MASIGTEGSCLKICQAAAFESSRVTLARLGPSVKMAMSGSARRQVLGTSKAYVNSSRYQGANGRVRICNFSTYWAEITYCKIRKNAAGNPKIKASMRRSLKWEWEH